jgi:hypothetical protein
MKTQTKLVLSLLLAQVTYMNINCNVRVQRLPSETVFNKMVAQISETRKLSFGKKPIPQLSLKEKEDLLTAIVENLFDEKHKDNFARQAECIAYVFDHKNMKIEHTTKEYQELAKFLRENKNCNSIFTFLGTVLPKGITKKVTEIVEKEGKLKIAGVLRSKLQ